MRITRKDVPEKIKETKLRKGETVAAYRKMLMILKWKNKKDVCILSVLHDYWMVPAQVKSKRGKERLKLKAVGNYNSNMGSVDLSVNLIVHFSTARDRLKSTIRRFSITFWT